MSVLLGGRNGATTCKEVHAPEVSPPPPNRADTQMQVKIYSCTERFGYPQLSKRNSTHTQLNPAGAESSFRKVNLPLFPALYRVSATDLHRLEFKLAPK